MRLWGVNPTNSVVVPQRLQLRFIVLSKLVYLLWNADSQHIQSLFLTYFFYSRNCLVFYSNIYGQTPLTTILRSTSLWRYPRVWWSRTASNTFWLAGTGNLFCMIWNSKKATISLANLLVLSFPAECKLKIKLSKTVVSEKMVQSISVIQC